MTNRHLFAIAAFLSISSTTIANTASEIFQKRIVPILNSPKASSCTDCHLSGVDLKDYIGDSQEATFASLRSAGLINLQSPEDSKLLRFIGRKPKRQSPISQGVREQELEAFRAWIVAACKDVQLTSLKEVQTTLGPKLPVEIVRHNREDRVVRSFMENIGAELGRCVNCHSPERNRNKIGKNGYTKEDVDEISWIVPRDPAATIKRLVETGNINVKDPESSPLLTKPVGLEDHGGGPKFAPGSITDKNYRRFLNDYASVVNGKYKSKRDLPMQNPEIVKMSTRHLRIVDVPQRFGDRLLRVDLFPISGNAISKIRWGTAEGLINAERKMWQNIVLAVAPRNSSREKEIHSENGFPAGNYLAKIYIDIGGDFETDRDYEFSENDLYGTVKLHGPWPPGYKRLKIVQFPRK